MAIADIRPSRLVTEEGGKYPFRESVPSCPTAKTEKDITKVGTQHTPKQKGHDTYVGIPGDGIVPR